MYTDQEFALILRKASELAGPSDVNEVSSAGFSLEEMKAIAREAGLDPDLVERAARLASVRSSESSLERVIGGPVKLRRDARFATGLTEERSALLLSAVRVAVEQAGDGEANASGISWHSVGERSQVLVTAHTEGEGTRVRVLVDRRAELVPTAVFTLLGALSVGMATLISLEAANVASLALGWSLWVGGVAGSVAVGRAVWASSTRKLREKADNLLEAVSRSLTESETEE